MDPLLTIDDLRLWLPAGGGERAILDGVTLSVGRGEAVGVVGESGSGKSMTARSIMRLLPRGARTSGSVRFDGLDVTALRPRELRRYRAGRVAMIFQDPRAHTNPVRRIGDFLGEALRMNAGVDARSAERRSVALLHSVGIADGERRLRQYPHELSGGLLQRVMIAAALAVEPELILADEPTTALDVTTQAEVVAILDELRRERGMAMVFITHDLELAAATCDRTAVMYAGRIVEVQPSERLHARPAHPYTSGLLCSRPSIATSARRLAAIPGRAPSAFEAPDGCPFAPRCPHAEAGCVLERPPVAELDQGVVACLRAGELSGRLPSRAEEVAVGG